MRRLICRHVFCGIRPLPYSQWCADHDPAVVQLEPWRTRSTHELARSSR